MNCEEYSSFLLWTVLKILKTKKGAKDSVIIELHVIQ